MTNVEKSYIRVTNGPTEPIHRPTTEFSYPETTTPKQESWTFESLDDWNGDDEFWNDDDETQFSNPEITTLLSPLIPEATTPKKGKRNFPKKSRGKKEETC